MTIKKIRQFFKITFDRISNEKLKNNILQTLPFWMASILSGLAAVFYSKIFAYLEALNFGLLIKHPWSIFILAPVCFLLAWYVVKRFALRARGSGVPEVMAAVELASPRDDKKVSKLLSIRIIVVKAVSSFLMILGGALIGKEGPTIQISGAIFRKLSDWLPSWWPKISKRNMIMAGAAAGLAAAFNTPLGGIVFAVEELTKTHISYFKTALFTAVIIAGLTAQGLLGPYLYLGYPDVTHISTFIFFPLIIVAVVTGLVGSLMSKVILAIFQWKRKFKFNYQYIIYIVSCGLVLAAVAASYDPRILGSGKEIMTTTLFSSAKEVHWYTAIDRVLGTTMSFTIGGAGGIFAPSLGAGAGVGSLIAGWLHAAPTDANLLILCGMVGYLTGVTRTPFTSAILVLEMTDRHNVIFHLMVAGLVASLVSLLVDRESLYDRLKDQNLHELFEEEAATNPVEANRTEEDPRNEIE